MSQEFKVVNCPSKALAYTNTVFCAVPILSKCTTIDDLHNCWIKCKNYWFCVDSHPKLNSELAFNGPQRKLLKLNVGDLLENQDVDFSPNLQNVGSALLVQVTATIFRCKELYINNVKEEEQSAIEYYLKNLLQGYIVTTQQVVICQIYGYPVLLVMDAIDGNVAGKEAYKINNNTFFQFQYHFKTKSSEKTTEKIQENTITKTEIIKELLQNEKEIDKNEQSPTKDDDSKQIQKEEDKQEQKQKEEKNNENVKEDNNKQQEIVKNDNKQQQDLHYPTTNNENIVSANRYVPLPGRCNSACRKIYKPDHQLLEISKSFKCNIPTVIESKEPLENVKIAKNFKIVQPIEGIEDLKNDEDVKNTENKSYFRSPSPIKHFNQQNFPAVTFNMEQLQTNNFANQLKLNVNNNSNSNNSTNNNNNYSNNNYTNNNNCKKTFHQLYNEEMEWSSIFNSTFIEPQEKQQLMQERLKELQSTLKEMDFKDTLLIQCVNRQILKLTQQIKS